jgi:hypothetical protein
VQGLPNSQEMFSAEMSTSVFVEKMGNLQNFTGFMIPHFTTRLLKPMMYTMWNKYLRKCFFAGKLIHFSEKNKMLERR